MTRARKPADPKTGRDAIGDAAAALSPEARQAIELRAYYLFCERGGAPGDDLADWLAAEREFLTTHRQRQAPGVQPKATGQ